MAHSKADLFGQPIYNMSRWNKVRSHPARMIILNHLLHEGPSPFFKINQLIFLHPSTVSQHLRFLIRHGFVGIQTKFPKAIYELIYPACNGLAMMLLEYELEFTSGSNPNPFANKKIAYQ